LFCHKGRAVQKRHVSVSDMNSDLLLCIDLLSCRPTTLMPAWGVTMRNPIPLIL
jgi:hypothetical protein